MKIFSIRVLISFRLLIQAWVLLIFYKLLIFLTPSQYWIKYVSGKAIKSARAADTVNVEVLNVLMALKRAQRFIPFKKNCLLEALTLKQMLRYKGIETTLIFGAAKDSKKMLLAHAWLTLNDNVIVGQTGHEKFTELYRLI